MSCSVCGKDASWICAGCGEECCNSFECFCHHDGCDERLVVESSRQGGSGVATYPAPHFSVVEKGE